MKAINDPAQSKFLNERTSIMLSDCPELKKLHQKLLSLGGDFVVLNNEPDLKEIITRGVLFNNYKVKLCKMQISHCHSNVANLWTQRKNIQIVTGWALSGDGLWRQHSWALQGKTIIETTEVRIKYFGFILTAAEAEQFRWDNW